MEANTDKARAKKQTANALERYEALNLVTQQEMDMVLKQSELEKALQHVSNPNLSSARNHQKKERVQSVGY